MFFYLQNRKIPFHSKLFLSNIYKLLNFEMFRYNFKVKRKPVDVNIQLINKDHSHIVKSESDGEIKLRAY